MCNAGVSQKVHEAIIIQQNPITSHCVELLSSGILESVGICSAIIFEVVLVWFLSCTLPKCITLVS